MHVIRSPGCHGSEADKQFSVLLAGMAIGLEMVQQPFQPALDRYIAKEVADQEAADEALREETEWDERWGFEFER